MERLLRKRRELTGEQVSALKDAADVIAAEQKLFEEGMGSSRPFSLESFYNMLKQVKRIRRGIYRKPSDKNLRNPDEKPNKILELPLQRCDLVRETLEFFKDLDEELYKRVLRMLTVDDKFEDIILRSKYAPKLTNPEYEIYSISGKPVSMPDFKDTDKRIILLGLHEDYSKLTADTTDRVLPIEDYCVYRNVSTCIHEIAHGFDMNLEKDRGTKAKKYAQRLQGKDNELPTYIEKILEYLFHKQELLGQNDISITDKEREIIHEMNMTRLYLAETTSIFCEYIYADFLAQKNPEIRKIAMRKNQYRIENISGSIDAVLFSTQLGIRRDDVKKLNEDYLIDLVTRERVSDKLIDRMGKKMPTINESRRYVMADMLVPSMVEVYNRDKEEGKKRFQTYLQCVRNNDFEGALNAFEIDIYSKEGIRRIMDNYKKNLIKYFPRYHDEDEAR